MRKINLKYLEVCQKGNSQSSAARYIPANKLERWRLKYLQDKDCRHPRIERVKEINGFMVDVSKGDFITLRKQKCLGSEKGGGESLQTGKHGRKILSPTYLQSIPKVRCAEAGKPLYVKKETRYYGIWRFDNLKLQRYCFLLSLIFSSGYWTLLYGD